MKQFNLSLLFILSIFLFSCDGDKNFITDLFEADEFDNLYTLIYVDLSTSQDSTSVCNTAEKIKTIYQHQPNDNNTRFIIRVIDKDHSVLPLLDVEQEGSVDNRDDIITRRSKFRDSCSKIIEHEIYSYYKNKAPYKKSSKESCICSSLENAHVSLASIDTSKSTIQLIVFSDMFEECGEESSYLDHEFYLCKKNGYKKTFEELRADVIQNYEPEYPISQYVKPKNLYFILTESDYYNEDPSRCLNPKQVEKIWDELFKKFGYSDDDIRTPEGIIYSTDIPERLINHEK